MATILTTEAQAGWDAAVSDTDPHLSTSPASDAWLVGKWLRINNAARPVIAAKGRGNTVRVDGHLYRLRYGAVATTIEVA